MALSHKKQDQLREHTSRIHRYRQMQRLGEFGDFIELIQVNQLLDKEEMHISDYLRTVYPAFSQRTIARKKKSIQALSTHIPNSVLKRITALSQDALAKFDRISSAAVGDICNAIFEMPRLPLSTDKDAEKYLEELGTKLLDERKHRRAKGNGKVKKDDEQAARNATDDVLRHLRATGLKENVDKRQWLGRVFGGVMEAEALQGALRPTRVTAPNGVLKRRGRPPKEESMTQPK